jgi:hypothetical protein
VKHPAVEIVRNAAETLDAALGDGGRASSEQSLDAFPAAAFDSARTLLHEAQRYLDARTEAGAPSTAVAVAEAMKRVREASNEIESTRGFVRWMPRDLVIARADALRLLDRLTGRW